MGGLGRKTGLHSSDGYSVQHLFRAIIPTGDLFLIKNQKRRVLLQISFLPASALGKKVSYLLKYLNSGHCLLSKNTKKDV